MDIIDWEPAQRFLWHERTFYLISMCE
jgi:hypothetical protein